MVLRIALASALAVALTNTLYVAIESGGGRAIQTGLGTLLPLLRWFAGGVSALVPNWAFEYHVFEGWGSLGPLFLQAFALAAAPILVAAVLLWPIARRIAPPGQDSHRSTAMGLLAIVLASMGLLLPMQRAAFASGLLGVGLSSATRYSILYGAIALIVGVAAACALWLISPRIRRIGSRVGRAGESSAFLGAFALLAGWGLGWGAPAQAPPSGGPNVLMISIDSLRADHLGTYGYERDTSPNLDRLAAGGVRFDSTVAPTSWTLPSHMSLLTGLDPLDHGVTSDFRPALSRSIATLAETFRAAGYETAGVSISGYVKSEWGFARGFDHYQDRLANTRNSSPRIIAEVHRWLEDWDGRGRRRPLFLFVHLWDVHYDFEPPAEFVEMFDPEYQGEADATNFVNNPAIHREMDPRDLEHIVALYDGEIRYTDKYIGDLLDRLQAMGELDNTIVSVTADHGEEFFDHGQKGHRETLYEEVLRVPWILSYPRRLPAGRIVEEQVRLIDVAPTVLSLAGVDRGSFGLSTDRQFGSRDLSELARGSADGTAPPPAFSHLSDVFTSNPGPLYSVRTGDAKLILNREEEVVWELYDLQDDPRELVNQAGASDPREAPLRSTLEGWSAKTPAEGGGGAVQLGEEGLQQLKDLGYIQ